MNEIIKFIEKNYDDVNFEQASNIVSEYRDCIVPVYESGILKVVGIYFKLNDETLNKVVDRELDLSVPENVVFCRKQNGRNIHFFLCVSEKMKLILKGIKMLIKRENPKTISWFSPDMKDIFVRRLQCHH